MFENYNAFGLAIVERAVEDYKMLKEFGVAKLRVIKEGVIYKKELEKFFRSEYCDFLLQNTNLTGRDILNKLYFVARF